VIDVIDVIDKCVELRVQRGKCGDDFNRAFAHWTTHAKTSARLKEAARRCKSLAHIYDVSLDKLLDCLTTHEPSTERQEEIDRILEFKRLLAVNVALLP
jgi:hypothetical protein